MIPVKHLLVFLLVVCSITAYAQFRFYEKGHDSYKAGKYDESVQYLTEYLTKSTRDKKLDIDVFYIRALSYYKQNKFEQAIPDFEETLLRGHENKGNIYWFMAKAYDKLGDNEESLNAYNNAIRELAANRESKAKLLFERSQINYKLQNIIETHNDLKEGLEAQPENADIKKELLKLEKEQYATLRQAEVGGKNTSSASTAKKETAKEQTNTPKSDKSPNANIPAVAVGGNTSAPVDKTSENKTTTAVTPVLSPLAELYKDEKRYALVIGNSAYPKTIGVLRNPKNDAADVAQELRDSHFDVTLLTDATYGQIRAALMKFKEKLDGGDPSKTVGLFYYAGHGVQFDDENYLVPIDATVEYEDDIPRYCFPINRMVLANMERSNTRMNIVILDACRNNPFPSLNRNLGNSGLGEMKRARGSFIAYATAPGSVASDGTGKNGLYTQELLKAMKKPGLTIEQVFKEVRMNVLKQSNNKQNTWDSSNIIGEFHFKY